MKPTAQCISYDANKIHREASLPNFKPVFYKQSQPLVFRIWLHILIFPIHFQWHHFCGRTSCAVQHHGRHQGIEQRANQVCEANHRTDGRRHWWKGIIWEKGWSFKPRTIRIWRMGHKKGWLLCMILLDDLFDTKLHNFWNYKIFLFLFRNPSRELQKWLDMPKSEETFSSRLCHGSIGILNP